ncbi:MAG: Glucosaminate ammonia-lyase [Chlamydiae bacterium]|nr:Glucosaminate ammonia-lyase [Chlamydiota bacterium]
MNTCGMQKILFLFLFFSCFFLTADEEVLSVAVIGAGPAGLGSALVTGREQIETHIFQGGKLGGPLNAYTCLGNWPASVPGKGEVVIERLIEQVKKFGCHFHEEAITAIDFSDWPYRISTDVGKEYYAKAVILAMGSSQKRLKVKGENAYMGKGVEMYVYATSADRFSGKRVVVVGAGLDAVKKACILAKTAERVTLVVRGNQLQKPFFNVKIAKKRMGKIDVLYHAEVQEICGDAERVTHIILNGPYGRRVISADALVLGIGIVPNTALVEGQVPVDGRGYILLEGRSQKTPLFGVFAAGNVSDPRYHQAAISAGDGMKAGYDAIAFFNALPSEE